MHSLESASLAAALAHAPRPHQFASEVHVLLALVQGLLGLVGAPPSRLAVALLLPGQRRRGHGRRGWRRLGDGAARPSPAAGGDDGPVGEVLEAESAAVEVVVELGRHGHRAEEPAHADAEARGGRGQHGARVRALALLRLRLRWGWRRWWWRRLRRLLRLRRCRWVLHHSLRRPDARDAGDGATAPRAHPALAGDASEAGSGYRGHAGEGRGWEGAVHVRGCAVRRDVEERVVGRENVGRVQVVRKDST